MFLSPQFVADVYQAKFCVRMLSSKSRSKPGFVFVCYPVSLGTEVECELRPNDIPLLAVSQEGVEALLRESKGSYTLSNREKRQLVVAENTEGVRAAVSW